MMQSKSKLAEEKFGNQFGRSGIINWNAFWLLVAGFWLLATRLLSAD